MSMHLVLRAALVLADQCNAIVLAGRSEVAVCVRNPNAAIAVDDIQLLRIGLQAQCRAYVSSK